MTAVKWKGIQIISAKGRPKDDLPDDDFPILFKSSSSERSLGEMENATLIILSFLLDPLSVGITEKRAMVGIMNYLCL